MLEGSGNPGDPQLAMRTDPPGRGDDGQRSSQRGQEVQRTGLEREAVVDTIIEALAPVQVDRRQVHPGQGGADHPCGGGFVLANKGVHESLVHVMPVCGKGRHTGDKRDAFGVDQRAVKIEENGVIHRGLRGKAIADQRCSR